MRRNRSSLFAELFDIGKDVLVTALSATTNLIHAQLGDSTTAKADTDEAEWWQHVGFASRPSKPTAGAQSCQACSLRGNDYDIVFATRDKRTAQVYGNLSDGETAVFASTGQARTLYKANGKIVHLVTSDNTSGGSTMTMELGPDGFHVVTPWGSLSLDASGITLAVGQAGLTLTPAGLAKLMGQQASVLGSVAAISGSVATCLGPAAQPLVPTSAVLTGPTGPTAKPSTNVFASL